MATIRHIAIYSDDPEKAAEFWRDVFGFEITGVAEVGDAWVTDGYLNIALLKRKRPEAPHGINHWGVTVDEDEKPEIYAKLAAMGIEPTAAKPIEFNGVVIDRPYVEDKARDVDGNVFDLSLGMREMREVPQPG